MLALSPTAFANACIERPAADLAHNNRSLNTLASRVLVYELNKFIKILNHKEAKIYHICP
jgi:hypothetical protein